MNLRGVIYFLIKFLLIDYPCGVIKQNPYIASLHSEVRDICLLSACVKVKEMFVKLAQ